MKKLRVLIVADAYHPTVDGTVAVVDAYYNYFKKNHKCMLVCPNNKTYSNYDRKNNIYWVQSTMLRGGYRLTHPTVDHKLKSAILSFKPDIIHCHSPLRLGPFVAKIAHKANVPVIVTIHTKYKDEFVRIARLPMIVSVLMRKLLKYMNRFDKVYTVSPWTAEVLRGYSYHRPIGIFNNGSSLPKPDRATQARRKVNSIYAISKITPLFIFIGRVVKNKGLKIILDAFQIVKKRYGDFKVMIIGSGADLQWMKLAAKAKGLKNNFIFAGQITNRKMLSNIIIRSSALTFPSLFDTDGIVIKECASLSVPSIIPLGSAQSDNIKNNYDGYICANTGKAYAEVIERIIDNPQMNKAIGIRAKKNLYTPWNQILPSVVEEYRNIIKFYKR